jgi:ribosomal protein S27E
MRIKCPNCKHPLRVPKSAAGKRVVCLACGEKITIPTADEAPEEAVAPQAGASIFDDDLPELAPLPPSSSIPYGTSIGTPFDEALARVAQSAENMEEHVPDSRDEEFSFPCKVCGTLLYTAVSRIGSMTRCPDCHSEFSVPSRPAKKKIPKAIIDVGATDIRLAPIESADARAKSMESAKTKEILDRAAIEADRERSEITPVATPFDSQRWLSLVFGCYRDPGLIFLSLFLGLCAGLCFYALHYLGSLDMSIVQIWILRAFLFIVFVVPILIAIAMCCMVILPMAANRLTRVEDWPFGRFGEAMGEIAILCTAVAIAAFPGGMLARLLTWAGAHPMVQEILIILSIWGFTPILLIGMIENNQLFQPFSRIVFGSIRLRPDSWGAMYFQTGLVLGGMLVLYEIAYLTQPWVMALLGLVLPFGLFLIANQYGVLAGRISDIAHLGFEGDFSEDNLT